MAGRCLSAVALVLALVALPAPVEAGLLTGTFVGSIGRADDGNKLGVMVGDTFTLMLSIDPDLAVDFPGETRFSFTPGDASFLSLQIGGVTFDEEDDVGFDEGLPLVFLSPDRMRIVGVDFVAELPGFPSLDEVSLRSMFGFDGTATFTLQEDIDTRDAFTVAGSVAFVDEPRLLLVLGLAALAWHRRRRRA